VKPQTKDRVKVIEHTREKHRDKYGHVGTVTWVSHRCTVQFDDGYVDKYAEKELRVVRKAS
jgi:hypothetical protein